MSRFRAAAALVARRDALAMLRSRYFQGSVVIQVLLVLALVAVSAITQDDGSQDFTVAVVESDAGARGIAEAAERAGEAQDVDLEVREEPDVGAVESAVEAGEADAGLSGSELLGGPDTEGQLRGILQSSASRVASERSLAKEGLSREQIATALDPPPLEVRELDAGEEGASSIAWVGGLLLYLSLLFAGYAVAGGIAEEKSSRVVELLLAAVRPLHVLVGKLVGIGLVCLGQVLLVVGSGVALALILGSVDLPTTTGDVAALLVVYFALGYALYGCAFAAAGAIVSRQEDMQSATAPLMLILVAGYVLSFGAIDDPAGGFAQVATFLPPIAPMVVPIRAAEGSLPAGELAISLALMVVAIVVTARLGARIYERSVLRMGAPLKLTEALRLARR